MTSNSEGHAILDSHAICRKYGTLEGERPPLKKEANARRKMTKIKIKPPVKETNLGVAPKGDRIQYLYC